jgi:hypothetical protein
MKRLEIILPSMAMLVHLAMAALGHPRILCLEAGGGVAFEDGNAPCCRTSSGAGTSPARPAACRATTMAGATELPCDQCLDIELSPQSAGQTLAAAPAVQKAFDSVFGLPAQVAISILSSPPPASPFGSLDPGGGLRIAHLRTIVLRC